VQPGVRALDRPPLRHLRVARPALARTAAPDDARLDSALDEREAQVLRVVAAVGEQRVGAVAAASAQGRDQLEQREQEAALVLVCARERDR
jgi:hypothetical protein